jgi:hypothetical protein
MQQDDQRPLAGLDVMQPLIADLGVAFTKFAGPVHGPPPFAEAARKPPLDSRILTLSQVDDLAREATRVITLSPVGPG